MHFADSQRCGFAYTTCKNSQVCFGDLVRSIPNQTRRALRGDGLFCLVSVTWSWGLETAVICLYTALFFFYGRRISWGALVKLGFGSYSFHLLHHPIARRVLALLQQKSGLPIPLVFFGAILASWVGAYILYLLVEAPTHHLARRLTSCHRSPTHPAEQ